MASVILDGATIADWDGFHAACRTAFGFPATYAGTMDAWIDCLSYLRDDDNMTRFRLKPNEVLEIVVEHAGVLKARAPELFDEVSFCIGGINERYEDYGEKPALKLVLR
jgi:RNAse (barnase) inhibitor barstar